MMNKALTAALLGGFFAAVGSPAFAQSSTPDTPSAQEGRTTKPGMMMGDKDGMKGMMTDGQMRQKMNTMMDNCNKMMEGKMQNKNTPSTSSPSPKQG